MLLALAVIDVAIQRIAKPRMMVWGIEPVIGGAEFERVYRAPESTAEFMGSQPAATAAVLRIRSDTALREAASALDSIRALRRWVHQQVVRFGSDVEQRGHSIEPIAILNDLRQGYGANCGPLSVLLIETLRAHGRAARQILIAESPPFRHGFGHALVETWVGDRWITQDPTVGTEWQVRGHPASASETALAWRTDVPTDLFADGHWDTRLPVVRRQYESSLSHVLLVRERARIEASLARFPFAKLLLPSLVDVSPRSAGEWSPFTVMTALAWLVYVLIPGAGLACLLMASRPAFPEQAPVDGVATPRDVAIGRALT
jgi:hypothetical protein